MDPLSVTASVLAILGAAGQVTKGLAKVRALYHAPAELSSLMNEVSDLRAILSQVASFSNQLEEERLRGPVVALKSHLSRALDQLNALNNLINAELMKFRADGTTKVSRTAWIRLKSDVESMQRDLRSIRVNIGMALGVVTSSAMARVELKVVEISGQLVDQQEATTAMLTEIAIRVRENGHTGREPSSGDNPLFPISSIARLREHQVSQNITQQNLPRDTSTQSVRLPRALRNLLGSLFVGYSGVPMLTPPCNEKTCYKRASPSVHISYYFPTWFLSRILNVTASFNTFHGPQLNMNVPRMVDWRHPLWRLAHCNDVASIQTLFSKDQASPFDVNAYGQSALHYAALNGRAECSRFLIEQGADMYLKDENGKKPIDSAWDLALSNRIKPEEINKFMQVFDGGDYIFTRQFSILHKIVLGIIQISLGSQLNASTTGIDEVDANGRTSLSWAAARSDDTVVKILLDHGANPEIRDFEGNTALNQAVKSTHLPTIQLLLDYGADTKKRDTYGGTVLHHACYVKDDPALLRPFIAAHVDVNAIDHDGDTALQYAVRQNHVKNVLYLLESNADPETANVEGETPILMAIFHQADRILQALLDQNVNHRILNSRRQTVLHAVACEGTVEAMKALANARLNDLDVLAKDSENRTCLDYFDVRESSNSAIQSAFKEMISSVKHETGLAQQTGNLTIEVDFQDTHFMDAVEWQTSDDDYHGSNRESTSSR